MFELRPRCEKIIVQGVLRRDDKILLLKNAKSGKYVLPGCVMKDGETVEKAFKKAIRKEVGLNNISLGNFINVWSFVEVKDKTDYYYSVLDFEFLSKKEMIKLDKKYQKSKWLKESEIDDEPMDEGQRNTLHKFFSLQDKKKY